MKKRLFALLLVLVIILLCSCINEAELPGQMEPPGKNPPGAPDDAGTNIGDSDETYGDDLENSGIYDGYFEGDSTDITVSCISGTQGAYTLSETTLSFGALAADSVYSISGTLKGNIIIDVGESYKLDLELHGLSLVSDSACPIVINSANKVSITAKKDTKNYVYDKRAEIAADDTTQYSASVYALCDLDICGKGELSVVSDNNNGIHTKDDLEVKNLTLSVKCKDNALKGNDSVSLLSGNTNLIATAGDGIKTTNSDISAKGKQRGTVSISSGSHTVYAACDGIDAAYNVDISGSDTVLNIYTDKYSNYSEEVTDVAEGIYYVRYSGNSYKYSVKYYNSESDFLWVNPTYTTTVSGGRSTYYYYSFPKNSSYSKMKLYVYNSSTEQAQEKEYVYASDYLTPSETYDTIALSSRNGRLSCSWTNYTTQSTGGPGGGPGGGGPGGMQDGNSDKGNYSTKGIKACNEIIISGGALTIKAYDDAIHAGDTLALGNGSSPLGNITISAGALAIYSNDDGIHADGALLLSGGSISVQNSYEGLEGTTIKLSGANVDLVSRDDGINSTATSGNGIILESGELYIYAGGDGIDSNSTTQYSGITFSGADVVVISTSGGNSAIDTERGYTYAGGRVLAIMPSGGMTSESTNCSSFSSIGKTQSVSISSGAYLSVNGSVTVKSPMSLSAYVVYLGDKSATVSTSQTTSKTLNSCGVLWE